MIVMAKKKPPRKGKAVNIWIPEDLKAALVAYLDSTRPRTNETNVVITALEDFLSSKGFWPPTGKGCNP